VRGWLTGLRSVALRGQTKIVTPRRSDQASLGVGGADGLVVVRGTKKQEAHQERGVLANVAASTLSRNVLDPLRVWLTGLRPVLATRGASDQNSHPSARSSLGVAGVGAADGLVVVRGAKLVGQIKFGCGRVVLTTVLWLSAAPRSRRHISGAC
jgi:hypothetical protein